MGTSVLLSWNEDNKEKHQYVFKLCYPTRLFYTQDEIPDGKLPTDLDLKYLKKYRAWLEHIQFIAEKIPDIFMDLYKQCCSDGLLTAIQSIKDDIASCDAASKKATELKRFGLKPVLHVG